MDSNTIQVNLDFSNSQEFTLMKARYAKLKRKTRTGFITNYNAIVIKVAFYLHMNI